MNSTPVELTEEQLWLAEKHSAGFLVALWLDPEAAAALAIPGGEPADNLHVTLAMCGDADAMEDLDQIRAIAAIDQTVRYRSSLTGTIAGYGRFIASNSSDGQDVFYATPDVTGLSELREDVVNSLREFGVRVSTEHGYSPHITLSYLDTDAKNPLETLDPLPITFTGVTVMAGTRRYDIPFGYTEDPGVETTISMAEATGELPLTAMLGSVAARPLLFSSTQEWISFLPVPGSYAYRDMNLEFTKERYQRILDNFNNRVFKQDLPINVEHDSVAAGAIGWIKPDCMRLAEDGSIEVKPEWTPTGRELVEGDRFRYTSAELAIRWQDPVTREWHKDVPVGLAVCTRPHFKTDVLQPLSASERIALTAANSVFVPGLNDGGDATFTITYTDDNGDTLVTDPVVLNISVAGDPGKETKMTEAELAAQKVKDDEAAAVALKATQDAAAAAAIEAAKLATPITLTDLVLTAEQRNRERQMFTDLTLRVELAERRTVAAESALKKLETERRTEKYTAEVMGRSAENGTAWFGPIQTNVEHLVSLADTYGDDSPQVKWAVTQKRNEAHAIQATNIFDPISQGSTEDLASVTAKVAHLAEQIRANDRSISPEKAISQVYKDNPDLYMKSLGK